MKKALFYSFIQQVISALLTVAIALGAVLSVNVPKVYACYTWQVGQRVGLKGGAEIREGSGLGYHVHTIVPNDNWQVDIIDGPRYADGEEWWDISRQNLDGGGTGWVYISQAGYDICDPNLPGNIYIASDIELQPDPNHSWPPNEGDKLIGRFTLGNNGGQSIHLDGYGIRMRRDGWDYWDFLYPGGGVDLAPGQTVRFDQNNERPLVPGHYRAEITWQVSGQDWQVASAREFDVAETPEPGNIYIASDLELEPDPNHSWPPNEGDKLIGRFTLGNNGGQSIHLDGYGVRMRRDGWDYWDFLYPGGGVDLAPGQTVRFDQNNERPLTTGHYRAEITWQVSGQDWQVSNAQEFDVIVPGQLELVDDLALRSDGSGAWPPQVGDKLIAHIRVRNAGDQSLHVEHIGVRGRRNGSENWDIGFWTIDLGGHQEWSLDPNNERPLQEGSYSFRITYSLDGSNWTEIGNEVNFTVSPPPGPYSISGRVRDNNDASISGVTISDGVGYTATTDSNGDYILSGLTDGTYTLTPSKSGWTFTPATRTVSVPPDATAQDFTGNIIDTTSPAAITDLTARHDSTAGTINLSWTAPGDDGNNGTASTYIVRYADSAIGSEFGWIMATDLDGEPRPQVAGSSESMTVSGLTPGQIYYFAIKTQDEVPNTSRLSNSPSAVAGGDTTPPTAITNLAASTGSTVGTVNLSWTAPGDDGNTGTASTYIVRYADSAIAPGFGWLMATDLDGEPKPQVAGSSESMTVSGLTPGQTYYFAIKTQDEVSNTSELSNSANATAKEGPVWTLMFYMDGDNNLDDNYVAAFNQLEGAADNSDVNILVAWDRSANGNSAYYEVQHDTDLDEADPAADYTDDVNRWPKNELRMNDAATLSDFIQWARTNYPAPHYALIICDHGTGLNGLATDDGSGGDWLRVTEWSSALATATSDGMDKIDVIFSDVCLMAMIEDAYQIRNYTDYYVASENLIWITGGATSGPYDDYMSSIEATTSPRDLATIFVNRYAGWLNADHSALPYTISAADLGQLDSLVSAVNTLASSLNTQMSTYGSQLANARVAMQKFDSNANYAIDQNDAYVDLYDFAQNVMSNIPDATIQNAAQGVMDAIQNCVIAEAHHTGSYNGTTWNLDDSHGVSVFFPPNASSFYNSTNYDFAVGATWPRSQSALIKTQASEVEWGPMLVTYCNVTQPGGRDTTEQPPLVSPLVPERGSDIYLPIILKAAAPPAPDLIVERITATSNNMEVVIKNVGDAPATDKFWVDVYFNPTETPAINKPWNTLASYGVVWGVTTPIAANGGSLTLTTGGDYYFPEYSSTPPLPVGGDVYALVDSINYDTTYGAVLESNEDNNLFGPVTSTASVTGEAPPVGHQGQPPSMEGLPPR